MSGGLNDGRTGDLDHRVVGDTAAASLSSLVDERHIVATSSIAREGSLVATLRIAETSAQGESNGGNHGENSNELHGD
jgi:hypothetical protein